MEIFGERVIEKKWNRAFLLILDVERLDRIFESVIFSHYPLRFKRNQLILTGIG